MNLPDLWFWVIAVFWAGFFVLEGFDFGVGMLHAVLGRSDQERRIAINTIGPFWDGNEVWLIVGGAAIFAAFPSWYATWMSAGYLAIVLMLVALIVRGVSFEFRGKLDPEHWRRTWTGTLTVGSLVAPLVLGIALGDLVAGLPIDSHQEFTGTFWDLFTGYGVYTGLMLVVLCLTHGAVFLALRTTGDLRDRAHALGGRLAWLALVAVIGFAAWTLAIADVGTLTSVALALPAVAVVVAVVFLRGGREGRAFAATAVAMGATVLTLFGSLYPDVMVSSTSASYNLTVANTASAHYALSVMTVVAAIFFPLVLLYQGYTYVVFRHRVGGPPSAGAETPAPRHRSTPPATGIRVVPPPGG